jgi:hypothetical protein
MDQSSLTWLANQLFEEQRSLRNAEDQLFNWSSSVFLAGLGALTGLRGFADASWGWMWRILLMIAVVVVIGAILMMAYLTRRSYDRNQEQLASILTQINPARPIQRLEPIGESQMIFYLKWGSLGAIGLVTLGLIWLLG